MSPHPKNISPFSVFAEITVPTKGLFSFSITSPAVQSSWWVKSGDMSTLLPVDIFSFLSRTKIILLLQINYIHSYKN